MKRLSKYKNNTYGVAAFVVLFFIAGFYIGGGIQKNKYMSFINHLRTVRDKTANYKFIDPLLTSSSAQATEIGIFSDLKDKITSYLSDEESKGNLYDYSFYFRDLNSSLWFGVNENSNFFPASLFKLPIAMAVYDEGEDNPSFLNRKVIYTEEFVKLNESVSGNEKSNLVVGQSYTPAELVEIMLTQSDNGAKDLLLSVIDESYIDRLFQIVSRIDLSVSQEYKISSRKYAFFLRVLYGASYLNEKNSELLLGYLSKSTFTEGLVAGVPGNILVAHKFGTYQLTDNNNGIEKQVDELHDCGIVYHLDHPYTICFMTKGKDAESLFKIISHISKIVYDEQNIEDKK